MTTQEYITIHGVKLFHTFRGHNLEVEVYTYQLGPQTYNLFKMKADGRWHCDVVSSHNQAEIKLDANPSDLDAMLKAFASMLKSRSPD